MRAKNSRTRWMRVALCACATMGMFFRNTEANGAPRIHIKGGSRLEARAGRSSSKLGGKLGLSGTLVDDTGQPLAAAGVALTVTREPQGTPPATPPVMADADTSVSLASAMPEACENRAPRPVLERSDLLLLRTDDSGRFCVQLTLATDRYVARLEARPSGFVEGTRLDLPVDLALEPVTLRFDPDRSVLSLDEETTPIAAWSSIEDDGVTTPAPDFVLSLSNEAGTLIGTATTDASGRGLFRVPAEHLGPPGRGELKVSFAGAKNAGASAHVAQVERRTRVDLVAADAHDGRLPAGVAEDGMARLGFAVFAKPRCVKDVCGAPTGAVEARLGDVVVGAAPLVEGAARVVVAFASAGGSEALLSVRYLPDAPWFLASGELSVVQPVREGNVLRKAPLLLAAAAVVAWLALTRLPGRSRAAATGRSDHRPQPPPFATRGDPYVDLVSAADPSQGWRGFVRDAHDGVAIVGARVAIERPGFERSERVAQTASDPEGAFALPAAGVQPGDELVAEGRVHGMLRRPVPPPGEVLIALVLRKRALLDRLVAWARRRPHSSAGGGSSEPTPGQVRQAAGPDTAVARWADAVERAAYGGEVVDERAETEVEELAPAERAGPVSRRR